LSGRNHLYQTGFSLSGYHVHFHSTQTGCSERRFDSVIIKAHQSCVVLMQKLF